MLIEDIQEVRRQVRDYVVSSFYVADPDALADSASLIETGIVDSTGVLELVAFLESTFGVKVGDEEMLPENLDSIARVARFVCSKKTCAGSAPAGDLEDAIDDLPLGDRVPEPVEIDQLNIG